MPAVPLFTVLIATHDHGELIRSAVASLQQQTLQDFELMVVGDGATPATREVVQQLAAEDSRLRFLDLPKEPGRCAAHRHTALQQAAGRFICYLDDDDLWLPWHLQTMAALLARADFAHTVQTFVHVDFTLAAFVAELSHPALRRRMCEQAFNFFGPTVAGHTLESYRRLPLGWSAAEPGVWNDLNMWRKFLRLEGLKTASSRRVTALHLPGSRRAGFSLEQRAGELRFWRAALRRPEVRERLQRLLVDEAGLPADLGDGRHEVRVPAERVLGLEDAGAGKEAGA